ncbi:MAG: hypothetical protein HFF04_06725 [Oscillospiraceae bacterium]|nr:hypothetical protein [Oscillospiraceae bacterium]
MLEFARDNWIVGVIALVVVVYIWVLVFYRGGLRRKMTVALAEGEWQKYERLLLSKSSRLLLRDDTTSLARANSLLARGDTAGCKKELRRVDPGTLDFEQKIGYFKTYSMLAINDRDLELHDKIRAELEKTKDEEHRPVIEDLKRENELNRKLYFDFDPTVIQDLEEQLKGSSGQGKGLVYMSLAKAYHLNGDEKLSLSSLKSAQKLLRGTAYEEMIRATMENTSLMD